MAIVGVAHFSRKYRFIVNNVAIEVVYKQTKMAEENLWCQNIEIVQRV